MSSTRTPLVHALLAGGDDDAREALALQLAEARRAVALPLASDAWRAAELLHADDDRMIFSRERTREVHPTKPARRILHEFLNLSPLAHAGSTEGLINRVHAFARDWGPIELCEHGWPAAHRPFDYSLAAPQNMCFPASSESVERWLEVADRLFALADIATYLAEDAVPPIEAWSRADIDLSYCTVRGVLSRPLSAYPKLFPGDTSRWMRAMLAGELSRWLAMSGVRPALISDTVTLDVQIATGGGEWFSSVVWQLALAIADANELGRCKNPKCRNPFTRDGRRRKYCSEHCADAGRRLASYYTNKQSRRSRNSAEKPDSRPSRAPKAKKDTGKKR